LAPAETWASSRYGTPLSWLQDLCVQQSSLLPAAQAAVVKGRKDVVQAQQKHAEAQQALALVATQYSKATEAVKRAMEEKFSEEKDLKRALEHVDHIKETVEVITKEIDRRKDEGP